MSPGPSLIVVESSLGGHHQTLLKQYLSHFLRSGLNIVLISPCSREMILRYDLGEYLQSRQLKLVYIPPIGRWRGHRNQIVRMLATAASDVIIFGKLGWIVRRLQSSDPAQDRSEAALAAYFMFLGSKAWMPAFLWNWILPIPWAALCCPAWRAPLHLRSTWLGKLWEKAGLAGPLLPLCRRVFCWQGEPYRSLSPYFQAEKLQIIADSTDLRLPQETPSWLLKYRLRTEGKIRVALLGTVSLRKGLRAFLEASDLLKGSPVHFMVAGQVFDESLPEELKRILRSTAAFGWDSPGNLTVLDTRIEDEKDLNWLVSNSDILYLAYCNFDGSSNLLTKAASFRIPVIVSENTVMGRDCGHYNLGWTVPADDAISVAAVITGVLNSENLSLPERNFSLYADRESEEKLHEQLGTMVGLLLPAFSSGHENTWPNSVLPTSP